MRPVKAPSIKDRRNGFSAAELTVVIAVIAILALTTIPLLTYVPSASVTAAARQVQEGLTQARMLALTSRQNVCLQIVPGGYRFLVGTTAGCAGGAPWTGLNTDGGGTFRPWSPNAFTLAGPSPVFTPFGTVSQAGVLTITGPQARTATVTVLPSGQVTMP